MIHEKLALVPHLPGCYQMKNKDNIIIYVGKSKNLKNRLTSYFIGKHTGKTAKLVSEITDFEYIVTNTEMESLLLEINLIKKYDPKYNILLRDDKTYPYIELTNEKIPRLIIKRNPHIVKKNNQNLFGPYPNVNAARTTVDIINRIYPLRKCNTMNQKPCLYYHIGECLGYCSNNIDEFKIKEMKNDIISFLNGNDKIIVNKLTDLMNQASEKLQFERAKEYKEMLEYINITLEKQKVELDDNYNRDVINYYSENGYISIEILFIRGGKLLDKKNDIFPLIGTPTEALTNYIIMFYDRHKIKPKYVLVPNDMENDLLSELFSIKFITPQKGNKKNLLELSKTNAKIKYHEKMELIKRDESIINESLNNLSSILGDIPVNRIELFDNSNLFGTFNVSGMVVFIDGIPAKNLYRKYKITGENYDDYHTMKEVIYRRYFKVLKEKLEKPDLIIVDGGIIQIHAAKDIIKELNISIPVVGLKKDDKHNTCMLIDQDEKEVNINKSSNLFHLLTRMQDEVHRYTITYHKDIRSKGALSSILDVVPGIGEKRKKLLLKKYHTTTAMKNESLENLTEIIPLEVAKNLIEYLNND